MILQQETGFKKPVLCDFAKNTIDGLTIVVITSILDFMVTKLQKELKQNKPFKSLEEEVMLNIARTAEYLAAAGAAIFKTAELTATQYNVLRILRGAGAEGLSCSEIGGRMVTRESDITRLLDRLAARELISRERPAENRRTVITRIMENGLSILAELDAPVDESNCRLLRHLGKEKLAALNRLLEEVRSTND